MRAMLGSACTGAIYGALALSAFGLAEASLGLGFSAVFPAWVSRDMALAPLTLLGALAYPALGAAIGLVVGVATPSRRTVEAVAMLCALALLTLTLALGGEAGRRTILICVVGSVGCVAAAVTRALRPTHRLAVFGSPWVISLAMAGVLHLTLDALVRGQGRGAVVAVAAWLVCLGGVALRLPPRLCPAPSAAGHVVAWLGLVALAWMGDGGIVRTEAHAAGRARSDAPNIVLITMDTVRRDHLSVFGYERPTTPNLEALADEGTRYTAAVSTGNMTLTSHGSIFTGRYPSSHGAVPPTHPLPVDVPTLAEELRADGYRTAAVVANHVFLHPTFGFSRGFDSFDYRVPALREGLRPLRFPRDAIVAAYERVAGTPGPRTFYRRASEITRGAVQWLDTVRGSNEDTRPFLLFLNYMDAHTPYAAPEPYASQFARTSQRVTWHGYLQMKREIVANRRRMTDDERRALIDAYDSGIAYADAEIGRVMEALKARGLFDDTLVIVTADHGEAFDEHGVVEHGVSLFEHEIGVPLIVKLPAGAGAARGGEVVRDPVSGVDLMPTILEVAGEGLPAGVEGRSLLHLDVDAREAPRHIFAEGFPDAGGVERAAFAPDGRKLLVERDGRARLFDVAADPHEQADVGDLLPSVAATMSEVLETTFSSARLRAPDGNVRVASDTPAADAGLLHRLRSVGYIR